MPWRSSTQSLPNWGYQTSGLTRFEPAGFQCADEGTGFEFRKRKPAPWVSQSNSPPTPAWGRSACDSNSWASGRWFKPISRSSRRLGGIPRARQAVGLLHEHPGRRPDRRPGAGHHQRYPGRPRPGRRWAPPSLPSWARTAGHLATMPVGVAAAGGRPDRPDRRTAGRWRHQGLLRQAAESTESSTGAGTDHALREIAVEGLYDGQRQLHRSLNELSTAWVDALRPTRRPVASPSMSTSRSTRSAASPPSPYPSTTSPCAATSRPRRCNSYRASAPGRWVRSPSRRSISRAARSSSGRPSARGPRTASRPRPT